MIHRQHVEECVRSAYEGIPFGCAVLSPRVRALAVFSFPPNRLARHSHAFIVTLTSAMFSDGERQRPALLKALLRNPGLLLLNESASNLDGTHERLAQNLIDRCAPQSARMIVAHHLPTVVDADDILAIEGGRTVGEGTYSQLLETSPTYREPARMQLTVSNR